MYPPELKYTKDHEWVKIEGQVVTAGITSYAANALGDIVYVELPPPGRELAAGEAMGLVESVKSVSDVYSPLEGTVVTFNDRLSVNPELLNKDPYGEGWMVRLQYSDPGQLDSLLEAEAYERLVEGAGR